MFMGHKSVAILQIVKTPETSPLWKKDHRGIPKLENNPKYLYDIINNNL